MSDRPVIRGRERVTHCCGAGRVTHPWMWVVVEPDGYERAFPRKGDAVRFIAEWESS